MPEGVREVIGHRLSRLSPVVNELLAAPPSSGESSTSTFGGHHRTRGRRHRQRAGGGAGGPSDPRGPGPARPRPFSHALIRTTLYEEISTNRRVRLHRAVARTLEGGGADVGEVAYHFYEAASLGDAAEALQWAQRAAEDATARAGYELAVNWYQRAIEIEEMVDPPDAARRAALFVSLGRARNDAGAAPTARSDFVAAAALARQAGRPDLLARAAVHYGGRWPGIVDPSDTVGPALLAEADTALPRPTHPYASPCSAPRSPGRGGSLDRDAILRPADQALAMARRLGGPTPSFELS